MLTWIKARAGRDAQGSAQPVGEPIMLRLAALLYSIVATSLAGTLIVVVLVAGRTSASAILIAAVVGALAALPVSWLIARAITGRTASR